MGAPAITGLVIDANTIIDYIKHCPQILSLLVKHLSPVYVTDEVLDELRDPEVEKACMAEGVSHVDMTYKQVLAYEKLSSQTSLSKADSSCLVAAQSQGWVCLTSDQRLYRECKRQKIRAIRNLRPLLMLLEKDVLTTEEALSAGRDIIENNSWIRDQVLDDYAKLVTQFVADSIKD